MSTGRANEPVSPVADDAFTRGLGNKECLHPLRYRGLTIREHFAALALQGMLANAVVAPYAAKVGREQFCREVARDAVLHADCLLAELEKPR